MKSCKIVLTGGPCVGKTTSMEYLKKQLIKAGKSVISVEETANFLLSLGYMPNVNISTFDFQNLLFKIQFLKEYKSENISNIVICDRGLLDGKVYIEEHDFERILQQNNMTEKEILSTYDMALYFKSIAYESPETFAEKRIYESPNIGIIRDKRCLEIWKEKVLPITYDNLDGFDIKLKSIYTSLIEYMKELNSSKYCSLSDYYGNEYIEFLFSGIDRIMKDNNISNSVQEKTRRLIR